MYSVRPIKRFDVVVLKTTENVRWVSGPAGRPASPKGHWSVVAGLADGILMLSKDETVIQIPEKDVTKILDYNIEGILHNIRKVRNLNDLERFAPGLKENEDGKEAED